MFVTFLQDWKSPNGRSYFKVGDVCGLHPSKARELIQKGIVTIKGNEAKILGIDIPAESVLEEDETEE